MRDLDRKKIPQPNHDGRPHVVILGAGASRAAFPDGDKHGRRLPLMKDLVEMIGLNPLLDNAGITGDHENFEALYSDLITSGQHAEVLAQINVAIFNYFAEMELPDAPTLYDHLVLSLRNKDFIATFNWDPFLWQALARNKNWRPKMLPTPLFLHGNTAVGCCIDHKPIAVRSRGQFCPRCNKPLEDAKLLYPVTRKNYSNDPYIAANWEVLRRSLEDAYLVTVFGYSAPTTDAEAIGLLTAAWGDPHQRVQEQIEIIDSKEDEELHRRWKPFIHSHHYETSKSFYDSIISRNPRRSCEAMWSCMVDIAPSDTNPIPQNACWDEVRAFYDVMFEDEKGPENDRIER